MLEKIREFLSGKKVYLLMAIGAIASILQYLVPDLNFNIDTLPPVDDLGDLLGQLWSFAVASGFRAAIAK